MLYFGYGLNTNASSMASRCPDAVSLGYAKLLDHKFRFAGPADVVPNHGTIVHGVLWDITTECLQALDILEGYPYFYDREPKRVIFRDKEVSALVYYMTPGHHESSPSPSYYEHLIEGYHVHGVPTSQLKRAARRTKNHSIYVGN
jgi:gamma-glutamylcyclotransferase (GGCT)/AIG2-like uncharacterized protein YtfP